MFGWLTRRGRAPSHEAQKAVEEAARLRAITDVQAEQWKHHLESNGFAELIAGVLEEDGKRGDK
jgi:hypothetical protein